MENNLECSIVIRTHNHKDLLVRLLKKIKEQEKIKDYEIIIIDSCSTDGTKEIAKKQKCKLFSISPSDFSHAYTFNLGAQNSSKKIIVYASVDIIPKDNFWLYYLLLPFKNKKVAGVFSKQEPIPNFNLIEEFKMNKIFGEDKSLAFFSNASGALRREVWRIIKYNENVVYKTIGGEDQQLISVAKKKGYKVIYSPRSVVFHSHKYSTKSNIHHSYMKGLNLNEFLKWNKEVSMLKYSKKDLIRFLIKKRGYKEIVVLIFNFFLIRLAYFLGRIISFLEK